MAWSRLARAAPLALAPLALAPLALAPLALVLLPSLADAQEHGPERVALSLPAPDEMQILELASGSRLIGRIVEISADEVRFASGELDLTIAVADIREVRHGPAASVRAGAYWFPDPNRTRLFFAPTARSLPRGGGYVASHLLFFPSFAYGITDSFTLGGGVSVFPGVSLDEQLAFATPKFGWSLSERLEMAVGALLVTFPGNRDRRNSADSAGILFSAATYGAPGASLTAGVGHGYAGDGWANRPMLMIGGERRFFRRLSVVTENWIFPGVEGPLLSYGLRFLGERMSVDVAAVHLPGEDTSFLPFASFLFYFGER